jgi:HPt (histidine-containing phosphotransfer) domain-containing protein
MAFDQVTNHHQLSNNLLIAMDANGGVDFAILNSFEELQSDDGSDLIVELIDLYLQDAPARLAQIREATNNADWTMLKRAAHNLKGSSGNLGIGRVAEICGQLEQTTDQDSETRIGGLVVLLASAADRARQLLAAERQRRLK